MNKQYRTIGINKVDYKTNVIKNSHWPIGLEAALCERASFLRRPAVLGLPSWLC
jgi:hypothetical protein